jgi:hypothetical protein
MFDFLFGSNKKINEKFKVVKEPKQYTDCFVVLHKGTREIIGVFDSFEKAKQQGQKATYHTCLIYSFKINENCKYLNTIVYEDN